MTYTIGLLHPGSMGSAFGAQLRARGHIVLWCPDGRSDATRRRAEHAGPRTRGAARARLPLRRPALPVPSCRRRGDCCPGSRARRVSRSA
jgi:hypothetical protein